jgi:glyoxylase-like metal-dependent hydrolase (beta-lactamase superfamily II)
MYDALMAAMTGHVEPFAPDAELIPGTVRAVEIKGHTPGHSGYMIGTGEDSLFYIGDAMHHYVVSVHKPEWAIAFDSDQTAGIASREAVLAQSAADGQRIYAVHFPFPGIGRFVKTEAGFDWLPEQLR